jgi:hypothetical protein
MPQPHESTPWWLMSPDDFGPAEDVIRRSALVRWVRAADEAIRTAAARSQVVAAAGRMRRRLDETPAVDRIRLTGIVMLAAAVVHDLLLPLVSIAARPIAPHVVHVQTIALALVLIAAAPAVARAWPRSRVRRWLAPGARD